MRHPWYSEGYEELASVVDDLDPTEDGEAGEEPHGAADETESCLCGDLHIPLNLVEGGCVEVNLDQL